MIIQIAIEAMASSWLIQEKRVSVGKRFRNISQILLAAFAIVSLQRFDVHPSGGHVHRQSDTIGMSMALAEQIREKGWGAVAFLFYPRVLQRGLLDGINASEFPLLNSLTFPGFLLSANPRWGVFFASLLVLFLNLVVAYRYLPRFLRAWGVETPWPVCLVLWFTGATLANQTNVVMPEGLAFPLVIAGLVYLVESKGLSAKFVLSTILCSLGIATKPTVVLALGAAAALPLVQRVYRTHWRRLCLGVLLSLIFPAYWYTYHAKHILAFAQGPQIFALAGFRPIQKLEELGFNGFLDLLLREPFSGQFPMFLGWFFVAAGLYVREWTLVALYFFALVGAMSLDGSHIVVHSYYFIGVSIFSLVLMARVLGSFDESENLKRLTLFFVLWGVLFNIRTNIWIWARDSQLGKVDRWYVGGVTRDLIGANSFLITDDRQYPRKLLTIGRSGDAAGRDVYEVCQKPSFVGRPLAIVADVPPPSSAWRCSGRSVRVHAVETAFEKWYVSLIR